MLVKLFGFKQCLEVRHTSSTNFIFGCFQSAPPVNPEMLSCHLPLPLFRSHAAALSSNPVYCFHLRAACLWLLAQPQLASESVSAGAQLCVSYASWIASHSKQTLSYLPWSSTGASLTLPYGSAGSEAGRKHLCLHISFWLVWLPEVVYCRDRWVLGSLLENWWEYEVGWFETAFLLVDNLVSSLSKHMLQK